MANTEHLEILKTGVAGWNNWVRQDFINQLKTKTLINRPRADLSDSNLSKSNLTGIDLTGIDLSGANLSGANLSGASLLTFLEGAQIFRNHLSFNNFLLYGLRSRHFMVNLSKANLSKSMIYGAYLMGANLAKADLSESEFFGSNLSNANLSGANLSNANLYGVNLSNANLSGANLSGADLSRAELTGAYLTGAIFTKAQFSYTILGNTDLSKCIGLETVEMQNNCIIDFQTLRNSKNIPKSFLVKIGLPELYIDYLPDLYTQNVTLFPAFLSHSKENRAVARKLYEALIGKGVNVFFDEKQLKPGDNLVKTITKGINNYDKTILICSKESLASTWVDYELELVLKKELALMEQQGTDDVGLLIPITIDDHIFSWKGPKEWDIKNRFIGDFRGWQDEKQFEQAVNELIHALNIKRQDIKPESFL